MPLRELGDDDLLIKVHSGPINPNDFYFIEDRYPGSRRQVPTIAGFEGSGLVLQTGKSAEASAMKDKRVAFFAGGPHDLGSWGSFTVVNRRLVIPLPDMISYEQGACTNCNPLSAEAIVITCKENGHACIINSPAASSLGKMLVVACKREGITLINLVRRPEQAAVLKDLGCEYILDSSSTSFEADLKATFEQLKPSAFFDGVGGSVGTTVFDHMPTSSTTYCYGMLSGEPISAASVSDLLFKKKTLRGWWITAEFENLPKAFKIVKGALENMAKGEYKTTIVKTFAPADFKEAMIEAKALASQGKVLIQNPDFNN